MKHLLWLIVALNLTACGFEQVDTGYRGVQTRFGEVVGEPLPEGLHFYNPFTSDITEISVREEKIEGKTSIFTKDTQRTDIEYAVTWYPIQSAVGTLFKEIGREHEIEQKIVVPVVLGSMKDAIGKVIADELNGKREAVTKSALEQIRENLKASNRPIVITDLQFTNVDFDDAYEKAVEEKVVAIQMAQKAKNETVQIEETAKQTVLTAKAAAEAMRIKSQALAQNKGLVQYELVQKWDGALPQYMFGNSVPMIDFKSLQKAE
nr:SPFH domain-containing protein [Bdellovibrio sp. CKG001]